MYLKTNFFKYFTVIEETLWYNSRLGQIFVARKLEEICIYSQKKFQ